MKTSCPAIPRELGFLISASCALFYSTAPAAPGEFDWSFGRQGYVRTDFSGTFDSGNALVILANGGTVVAGITVNGDNSDFALACYKRNGDLDLTFGSGGRVSTDFDGRSDNASSMALQNDGKILVVGTSREGNQNYLALARYSSNGMLDMAFGSGGRAIEDLGTSNFRGWSVALQADGKILATGYYNDGDFRLMRFLNDGSLDSGFGAGGIVGTDITGNTDISSSLAVQPDGKILVGGTGNSQRFALVRFLSDGSLDVSFGSGGRASVNPGTDLNLVRTILLQGDGKILVAGICRRASGDFDLAIARFNPNGSLDLEFGIGGVVITDTGGSDDVSSLVIQDGKIVLSGVSDYEWALRVILVRYLDDGSLDESFGVEGIAMQIPGRRGAPSGFNIQAVNSDRNMALQPDGRILLAGSYFQDDIHDFGLARFEGDTKLLKITGPRFLAPVEIGRRSQRMLMTLLNPGTESVMVNGPPQMKGPAAREFRINFPIKMRLRPGFKIKTTVIFIPRRSGSRRAFLPLATNAGVFRVNLFGIGRSSSIRPDKNIVSPRFPTPPS